MSNSVFPTLAGLTWSVGRAPQFNTRTHTAISGRELRAAFQAYPLWKMTLNFEFLRDMAATPELKTLAGLFLTVRGSWDSFLFTDPADNAVTDMSFGAGDGATTRFQLTRAYGAGGFTFAEPVQNINVLTNIKIAGVTKTLGTDYTVSSTGMITFTVAPTAAAALTWTGTFYYRCRFLMDEAGFSAFMKDLWELRRCEFIGAIGNKV